MQLANQEAGGLSTADGLHLSGKTSRSRSSLEQVRTTGQMYKTGDAGCFRDDGDQVAKLVVA